ncbi:uncharacterized protein LOC129770547 [Toxorhynchites rutilus septentrionalis]|uniref:uncharacterized protein LOC129770547 n=1 Tax=Toxorhynchites rutilus septentrionalis TaxID=329112 RepID=UPI002478F859|nr:uncharacterized protein LOC129770547 [Toxorhynchites rutilus septentrionalis]
MECVVYRQHQFVGRTSWPPFKAEIPTPELKTIEVTRKCLDSYGKITAETTQRVPNKTPGEHFQSYAEVDKTGNALSSSSQGNSYNNAGVGNVNPLQGFGNNFGIPQITFPGWPDLEKSQRLSIDSVTDEFN